jgi:hypothetical protein
MSIDEAGLAVGIIAFLLKRAKARPAETAVLE